MNLKCTLKYGCTLLLISGTTAVILNKRTCHDALSGSASVRIVDKRLQNIQSVDSNRAQSRSEKQLAGEPDTSNREERGHGVQNNGGPESSGLMRNRMTCL